MVDVFVSDLVDALLSVKTDYKLKGGPISQLIDKLQASGVSSIPMSYVIRLLVEAGCSVECLRDFMLRANIIQSDDDWVQVKPHVERAVLLAKVQLMKGVDLGAGP